MADYNPPDPLNTGTGWFEEKSTGDHVFMVASVEKVRIAKATGNVTFAAGFAQTGAALLASTLGVTGALTPTGGIAAAGGQAAYPDSVHTLDNPARASTDGTDATPVATEYYVAELFVPCTMSVTGIAFLNGSVAGTDSRHAALAKADGTVIAASATGAVAFSGTDAYQKVPFTGGAIDVVGPASYFVAMIISGTTDRYNAHPAFPGLGRAGKITGKTYGAIADFTPPTTFTADVAPIASLY